MEGQASGQLPPAGGHSKRGSRDYGHHYDAFSSQASSQLQVEPCIMWLLCGRLLCSDVWMQAGQFYVV